MRGMSEAISCGEFEMEKLGSECKGRIRQHCTEMYLVR
jgi:hypothetical protein